MMTPIEIRQQTFKKSLRGYDKEEVNSFLNAVSMEYEKLLDELKSTKNELEKTQSNLDSLKKVESVLHKTLLQAEQTSKSTMENAKKNAELKIQEAESKHKEILSDAMKQRSNIEIEINELVNYRNEILQQLKSFLSSQTQRLDTFENQEMKSKMPERKGSSAPQKDEESFFEHTDKKDKKDQSRVINEIVEEL